jgi:protein arginine kinase
MLNEHRRRIEDRVGRARGILANARMMSSEEALHLLSQIRLGVIVGLLEGIDLPQVNRLFILSRPAHLQKAEGRELDAQERDQVRADFLRKTLAAANMPGSPVQS